MAALERDPPQHFLCPITRDIMVDPVITASGVTYERANIQELWRNTHAPSCPVTRVPIRDPGFLLVNGPLAQEIQAWRSASSGRDVGGNEAASGSGGESRREQALGGGGASSTAPAEEGSLPGRTAAEPATPPRSFEQPVAAANVGSWRSVSDRGSPDGAGGAADAGGARGRQVLPQHAGDRQWLAEGSESRRGRAARLAGGSSYRPLAAGNEEGQQQPGALRPLGRDDSALGVDGGDSPRPPRGGPRAAPSAEQVSLVLDAVLCCFALVDDDGDGVVSGAEMALASRTPLAAAQLPPAVLARLPDWAAALDGQGGRHMTRAEFVAAAAEVFAQQEGLMEAPLRAQLLQQLQVHFPTPPPVQPPPAREPSVTVQLHQHLDAWPLAQKAAAAAMLLAITVVALPECLRALLVAALAACFSYGLRAALVALFVVAMLAGGLSQSCSGDGMAARRSAVYGRKRHRSRLRF